MTRHLLHTFGISLIALLVCALAPSAAGGAAGKCGSDVIGSAGNGLLNVTGLQQCDPTQSPGPAGSSGPPTEWFDCGTKVTVESVAGGFTNPCQQVALVCETTTTRPPGGTPTTNTGIFQRNPTGGLALIKAGCNTTLAPVPAGVSPVAVWQEIRRRVPHPAVRVAPASGKSLVNIQTLLWADTPTQVELGTVRLAGQLVRLRVVLRQVVWDFGDGHTDTTTDPGKAYNNDDDPCDTKMCPDYYGHLYDTHGLYTVTAQTSWTGQFQVAGGPWRQIPNPVTGPPQSTTIHVYEARGELVPDPEPAH